MKRPTPGLSDADPRGRAGRRRRRRLGLAAAVGLALGVILSLVAVPDHQDLTGAITQPDPVATRAAEAVVTIGPRATATEVPRSFFGVSTEYWSLPEFARNFRMFERALALLHVHGDGPFVLRIGGDSADHTFWDPEFRITPRWAFEVTPSWWQQVSALVRREHVRLILDLNLVTDSALTAAGLAQAALEHLPHGSIVGFEIGNEPDIYDHRYWMRTITRAGVEATTLPRALSRITYDQSFQLYAQALAQVAPGMPLLGPAIAHPSLGVTWISSLLSTAPSSLRVVSAHMYPFSACVHRRSPSYPTIGRLLSQRAAVRLAQGVRVAVRLAHEAGLPFRLTELNSVTCGGLAGVSNTFATALWAPDALFELLQAGVDGVNMHVRADAINAPFAVTRKGLEARPLLYGLILFTRALGPSPQLVHLKLQANRALNLTAWAVRVGGDVLHILLIDKGNRSARVSLRIPSAGPATVQRLLAPSVTASSGVTLGGQWLGPDGRWRGQAITETILHGARGYALTVPPFSAALVQVPLRPGSVARPPRGRPGPMPAGGAPVFVLAPRPYCCHRRGERGAGRFGLPVGADRLAANRANFAVAAGCSRRRGDAHARRASRGRGTWSKCVKRRSSSTRASTSGAVRRSTRSVPNSSTLKEASEVP